MRNITPQSPGTEPSLISLLQAWRSLSESERRAIESSEWNALKAFQAQKVKLQAQMDTVLQPSAGRPESGAPALSQHPLSPEARELVTILKQLEQENRALLEQKLSVVRTGMAQVNASVRHLRQVHQAYGQTTTGIWQSYS